METVDPDKVKAQLERLYQCRYFRGAKLRRLLGFLVEEWITDGGKKLTVNYIGESMKDERLTFEEHSDKWGYPKTRANLVHVRNHQRKYYETEGYRDPVIIKLNPGSFAPMIGDNPISTAIPDIDPSAERLILRAKTAIDTRTFRGMLRAARYYEKLPFDQDNPRITANFFFLQFAVASIAPYLARAAKPFVETAIAHVKASGFEPWELVFSEACVEACYRHNWKLSLQSV